MKLFQLGEAVFVELGKNYLLCIGRREEIEGKPPEVLNRMIWEALAYAKYREIENQAHMTH